MRLLQGLQQAVCGISGHDVGRLDDGRLALPHVTGHGQVVHEITDLLDDDRLLVLELVEPVQVRVLWPHPGKLRQTAVWLDPQFLRHHPGRRRTFAHARWSCQHYGMRQPLLAGLFKPLFGKGLMPRNIHNSVY